MQDEPFMRGWNDGHERFSADITRGLKRLATASRRFGEWIAPSSAPGEDSAFTRIAARCAVGIRRAP